MHVSYNRLWKLLIDKNLKKKDMMERCNISSASVAKLSKGDIGSFVDPMQMISAIHGVSKPPSRYPLK